MCAGREAPAKSACRRIVSTYPDVCQPIFERRRSLNNRRNNRGAPVSFFWEHQVALPSTPSFYYTMACTLLRVVVRVRGGSLRNRRVSLLASRSVLWGNARGGERVIRWRKKTKTLSFCRLTRRPIAAYCYTRGKWIYCISNVHRSLLSSFDNRLFCPLITRFDLTRCSTFIRTRRSIDRVFFFFGKFRNFVRFCSMFV